MVNKYESWGRYPKIQPESVLRINWLNEIPDLESLTSKVLPYGLGRSYGDTCLIEDGMLLDMSGLNRFIEIDFEKGEIEAQAGVTLEDILRISIPKGWFLSVTPGTKYVTLGGAIANDVHGKNHHKLGTFGCHVISFDLLRSDGQLLHCSQDENYDMFCATIGGLGLTGLILRVRIKLIKCGSPILDVVNIKFHNLSEFFDINDDLESAYDYTVSWVDCTASGGHLGRGIYSAGNFKKDGAVTKKSKSGSRGFPFDYPFINAATVFAFNVLYYNKQIEKRVNGEMHYEPFFYPLDAVSGWNRAYGKQGFLQYQFVVPPDDAPKAIDEILNEVSKSGFSSFLTVLKTFGNINSPGMLSFPRKGVTMAIDFRMNGERTLNHLIKLDDIVKSYGGILYPAKDARMSASDFHLFYPEWSVFTKYIDSKFASHFVERVTK